MSQPSGTPTPSRRTALRLTAAWAVLGATLAVASMYWPAVFDGRHGMQPDLSTLSENCYDGVVFWTGHVRLFGITVYEDNLGYDVRPETVVRRWHTRVTCGLAGLGGLCGAVIGCTLRRFGTIRRPPFQTDRRMWLVASAGMFGVLATGGVPGIRGPGLWRRFQDLYRFETTPFLPRSFLIDLWTEAGSEAVRLTAAALAIGWAVQAIAVSWGLRFPGRRLPEQAADYSDQVHPQAGP